jgi:hypothetical protein
METPVREKLLRFQMSIPGEEQVKTSVRSYRLQECHIYKINAYLTYIPLNNLLMFISS